MQIRLTPRAERQLAALLPPAVRSVLSVLRVLEAAPHSGIRYPADSPFAGLYAKNVIVRPRRWSYRVTYELRGDVLWILSIVESWKPVGRPSRA